MNSSTPSQTIGPFFHGALKWLVSPVQPPQGWVTVRGNVLDREGRSVADALLEISLSESTTDKFRFQRVYTNDAGDFQFVMPATSHGHVTLFARGLLKHLFTRVYLEAQSVPNDIPPARRATLVAQPEGDHLRWDIRLSGQGETVFFELQ
jgi:protocatechuate 3,4-dioxygenase, alpha subunit